MKKVVFTVAVVGAVILGVAPFVLDGEHIVLNEETRAGVPGSYVGLEHGLVRYELGGPEDGQPVVLVHGFSTPYFCWNPTFASLTAAGFRVLRYDLYGHGYSDKPDMDYTLDTYVAQVKEVVARTGLKSPFDLIGWSMGGIIVASFTDRYPEEVRRLVLTDPAGFRYDLPPGAFLAIGPGIGEYIMKTFGGIFFHMEVPLVFHEPERFPEFFEDYFVQLEMKGYRRAMLSTLRNMPWLEHEATYARVGNQEGRPIMLLWGREDKVTPFATSRVARALLPSVEFHAFDNAAHAPFYESAEAVNPLLREFLSRDIGSSPETHE